MRDIRSSCLLVSECDTPDELRQAFDDVYAILKDHRAAIEELQKSKAKPPTKTSKKKGGKQ